jgi:DNA-binding MarR family transcriptional regulator
MDLMTKDHGSSLLLRTGRDQFCIPFGLDLARGQVAQALLDSRARDELCPSEVSVLRRKWTGRLVETFSAGLPDFDHQRRVEPSTSEVSISDKDLLAASCTSAYSQRLLGQSARMTRGCASVSKEEQIKLSASTEPAQQPDDLHLQINLRLKLDEVTQVEATALHATARRAPTRRELCQLACRIYDARRARDKVLDRKLFGEPAWDMLLALFCLPSRGELLSVSALSYASAVPQTTALRWQGVLTDEGLIERGPQAVDARRQIVRLTAKGRALMEAYLIRLFYCATPVPPS